MEVVNEVRSCFAKVEGSILVNFDLSGLYPQLRNSVVTSTPSPVLLIRNEHAHSYVEIASPSGHGHDVVEK